MKVAASPPKKEANPASLRSAAPSKGRGSRGRSLLPMEGGAPKGRRLDGESGMKKSGKDRLKCVVYESTLSTAGAVPLPQWGRLSAATLCAPNPQPPVTSHSSLLSNFLRIPFSISSSRAQPSIFLALRSGSHKHCTETTPRCYVFLLLHILRLSVCKEDFSLRSK